MAVVGRTGVRFAVETALIVATAAGTGLAHLGAWTIVGAVVVVWLATSLFEYSRSHPRPARVASGRAAEPLDAVPEVEEPFERVRVLAGPDLVGEREAATDARLSDDEPLEDDTQRVEETEPSDDADALGGAEPEPEPEPEPQPPPRPEARHDVDREPEAQPEPEPEPVPVASAPWSWNVWNLERVVRERASTNEELGFLLLYLRDYASPSGMLPPDFDSLVRESFGDLLAAPV